MKSKMKVLQVCSYYYSSLIYKNLFSALETQGLDEDVYVFTSKMPTSFEQLPNLTVSRCFNEPDRVIFWVKHKKVYDDFKLKMADGGYDLLHAHSLLSNGYIAWRHFQDTGTPYVATVRNSDLFVLPKFNPFLKDVAYDILRDAQKVIFISEAYRTYTLNRFVPQDMRDDLEAKSLVLPNGIDRAFLEPVYSGEKAAFPPVKLLYTGRVADPNKNVKTLIHAADLLNAQDIPTELTLLGSGRNARTLEGARIRRMVSDRPYVFWKDKMPLEDVKKAMQAHHIVAMASKLETFGLVYAEGMSQGCPVIYTAGQGFDGQYAQGEVGFAVHHNDLDQITQAVKAIMADYEAMSSRALHHSRRYDWNHIAGKYLSLYEEVVQT